ncbi:MAG: hypothetical protein K9N06_02035 [Candidatus Cloacimonetes bacterium]|nr:hypothetical protein [Candidatus Cloacimonadota bacterium]
MVNRKRLKILMLVALCLAIVQLIITFKDMPRPERFPYKTNSDQIIKPAAARSAIASIRSPKQENRIVESKDPGIFFTLKDIECRYLASEEPDLSQEVILDTTIPSGEILLEKSVIYIDNENTYFLAKWKRNGKTILFKINKCGNYYPYIKTRYSGLSDLFFKLSDTEIILSMNFDYLRYLGYGYSYNECNEQFKKILLNHTENIDDENLYQIYLKTDYNEIDSLFQIRGNELKDLLEYRNNSTDDGYSNSSEFNLTESIACNDHIPYKLKRNILGNYISSFFTNYQASEVNKKKYLDFLIKMVTDYPDKPYSLSRYGNEMAQYALEEALDEYLDKHFTSGEIIDFCDQVMEITTNPRTVLLAYAMKTHCYLDMENREKAAALAIEAMQLYDEQYSASVGGCIVITINLNTLATVSCINYILKREKDPEQTLEFIELFTADSTGYPGFQNYLLYVKALVIDWLDTPLAEVIAAYKMVTFKPEFSYHLTGVGRYAEIYSFGYKSSSYLIEELEKEIAEMVTIDKPFLAKKYLMSDDMQIFNESGQMEVTIIQHSLLYNEKRILGSSGDKWQKAEINGDIYWIKIQEENEMKRY